MSTTASLLVAKDNPKNLRRLRIETGRGVQGSLTDLQSKKILQEVVAPYFQRDDFAGGLDPGVNTIMALLEKEQLPAPPATPSHSSSGDFANGLNLFLFFAFFIVAIWMNNRRGRGRLRSRGWGNSAGVILGGAIGNAIGNAANNRVGHSGV